jgi:MarR family transcriptional regulator, organic hydroperoxide resistance regulator
MKPETTIDFHIRSAWSKISRMYNEEALKYGVNMSTGFILLNIDREGTPSTKLGPKMGMESTSFTRTLKQMEEIGLIVRTSDKKDKRKSLVFLTEEGLVQREVSKNHVIKFNAVIRAQIPKEKLQIFFEVMDHLDNILDVNAIFKDN